MFASLYHAHHSRNVEDIPFWLSLAQKALTSRPGDLPVLELGCGTGRVLLALAQVAQPVYGLDRDPQMLAFLQHSLTPEQKRVVRVLQADFTQFRLAQRFGLILMPCNTFSTLSPEARGAVLKCVSRHLQPGGVFAASLPNPSLLRRLPASSSPEIEESFPHPVDGEPVQVSSSWERLEDVFTVNWDYDHLLSDGTVEHLRVRIDHSLTPLRVYLEELRSAGFERIQKYGDFNGGLLRRTSPYLILAAA